MTDETIRKAKRLLDAIEAFRIACKQMELHSHEVEVLLAEEIKSGEVHDPGTPPEPKRTV